MSVNPDPQFKLDVVKYLDRINYKGSPDGSARVLSELQEAHFLTVPYENFDILSGKPISLEPSDLYEKIVINHRGGYCFELNGLFGQLLRELGYKVTEHFARFLRDEPQLPKPRHRILVVEAEGNEYFVDAGIGGIAPRRPLLMTPGLEQKQGNEAYRLLRDPELGNIVQEYRKEKWSDLISFHSCPAYPVDFVAINYWCQHAEESIFNKEPKAALQTPDGRITMQGRELRIFSPEGVKVIRMENEEEFRKMAEVWLKVRLK